MNNAQDDEINLFEFFQTLWDGKWIIIATTFIAAVIGVSFSVVKPNSFEVSIPFQSSKQSAFFKYTSLNDLLKSKKFSFSVDEDSISKIFIEEFNDYKEMVDAVSKSEFVKKAIKDLDDDDKQRALIGFAKSFELKVPSKNKESWVLSFEWNNASEGLRLVNDAIQKTLINTRNALKSNVDNFALLIDVRNTRELERLRNELSIILQKKIDSDKKQILYLIEQSAIAKELGIEANRLGDSSNGIPYYTRGYKSIDKERSIIENRTEEEKLLNANGYLRIKHKMFSLEKDFSSSQLRNASKMLETYNPNDWVEFDLAVADVKSQKKSMLYVALSIVLGGMVGVMYVLISNVIRKRKE